MSGRAKHLDFFSGQFLGIRKNTEPLQVLLKDPVSGLYYAGRNARTDDPSSACDFRQIDFAARHAVDQKLVAMQIILLYHSPACQLTLPVVPEWVESAQIQAN